LERTISLGADPHELRTTATIEHTVESPVDDLRKSSKGQVAQQIPQTQVKMMQSLMTPRFAATSDPVLANTEAVPRVVGPRRLFRTKR
jgi:hypothetical protein